MVIAGPNPSVDRFLGVERFDPGHVHRADAVTVRVGGGGINAARVAARLGAGATLVAILPAGDEAELVEEVRRVGVEVRWVRCAGSARVATIMRERQGRTTMLTEPGAQLDVRDWEAFRQLVLGAARPGRALLCSGSLPPGAPVDGYAALARHARHAGSRCLVDAAGEALAATLEAGEGLLVPNLAEAEAVLGVGSEERVEPEHAPQRAREAAQGLILRGAHAVAVTAGGAGVAYAERGPKGRCGWVPAPSVALRNPVGAGDAFAAALALRIEGGARLDDALAFAVLVAAAHVASADGEFDADRLGPPAGEAETAA